MRFLRLQPCPKAYIHETHRSKTPGATLRFIERMKEVVGVMAFQDATGADRTGIPVFTCERMRPDRSRTSHTGKGVSGTQAQVSLLMEAIERYSSEFRGEYLQRLVVGSYGELKTRHPVLDPRELILPEFSQDPRDTPVHWAWGYDILREEAILVPACAVYHPFHVDGSFLLHTHTNGLASGNTMEEAVFHGMTEVIERDAWSIAKFRDEMDDALTVDTRPGHGFLLDLIGKFADSNIEVVAKDITTEVGVPVVAAFSQDLLHPDMMPVDGFGAHLDPCVAMGRALMEIATTRALFLQKHGFQGLRQNRPYHDPHEDSTDARFYARRLKELGSLAREFGNDILSDIHVTARKLRAKGFTRVIVVDLTRADVGVPTVRVIIPGMEVYCFDKSRRGDRLHGPGVFEG